jgi:stress response protein YsnF
LRVRVETSSRALPVTGETTSRRVRFSRIRRGIPVDEVREAWRDGDALVVPVYEERLVVRRQLVLVEEIHLHTREVSTSLHGAVQVHEQRAVIERQEPDGSWRMVDAVPDSFRGGSPGPVEGSGPSSQAAGFGPHFQRHPQESVMRQTVVGVFDRYEAAKQAAARLQDSGFGPDSVHLTGAQDDDELGATLTSRSATTEPAESRGMLEGIRNFFAGIFGADDDDDSDEHLSTYAEAVKRGGTIVRVDVEDEPKVELAREALQSAGAVNIEERAAEWRQSGWAPQTGASSRPSVSPVGDGGSVGSSGVGAGSATSTTSTTSGRQRISMPKASPSGTTAASGAAGSSVSGEEVIPVVREDVAVGKRVVDMGGVRVFSRTVERPVSESIELREEHARVERHPVDSPASEADLASLEDRTIEIQETAERPVVQKTARVVEEVVVGKDASTRSQDIQETVRETEVKVEPFERGEGARTTGTSSARPFEQFESDFQSDFQTRYASEGGQYADYEPAYRYGHSLAGDQRYSGQGWDAIESGARSDWEQRYPGSTWERFKEAVRRGWERATS